MNLIDELIAEHCPQGVEFWPLKEVAKLQRGTSITKKNTNNGAIPVVAGGRTAAYFHTESNRAGQTIVIAGSGAYAGFVSWWETPIFVSDAFSIQPNESLLLPKYCFHWLLSQQDRLHALKSGGGVPHVYAKDVGALKIPAPPLEIQREIVRILDEFSKLEAELEAELEARKVQHDHYRNSLLRPTEKWFETTIGDVAEVFDGPHATPKKTEFGPWYLSISSLVDGRFDLSKSAHLSSDDFPQWTRRVEANAGDTMFSYETRLGQAAFWEMDEPAALGRRMGILRPDPSKVNPRFLTLLYLGPIFQALIKSKTVSGSTVDRIPIRDMAGWPIQLPPRDEQDRLVQVLDSFDALVNDLSIGLPAELAARRQQYEYYRDKLFTFKELEAAA